jgi:hypothetical protein
VSDWILRNILRPFLPTREAQGTEIVDPYKHETRYKQTVTKENMEDGTIKYSTKPTKDEKGTVDLLTACHNDECKEKDELDRRFFIWWVRKNV